MTGSVNLRVYSAREAKFQCGNFLEGLKLENILVLFLQSFRWKYLSKNSIF